jgi:hypothetical protein
MSARSERRQPACDEGNEEDGRPLGHRSPTPRGTAARRDVTTGGALTGIDDVRAPLGGTNPPGGAFRLRRRDLLTWGGAAMLLPALSRPARAQAAATAAEVPRPMSVGFVDGSEAWRGFRAAAASLNRGIRREAGRPPEPARVVPATSLIAGQQELANELVRVRIHGLYPIPNPTQIRNAYVTVYFPSDEPARRQQPLPFTAWGYHSRPAPDPAPPTRFVAPLGADGALDFLLEATAEPNGSLTRRPSLFSPSPGPLGGRFATSFTVDWFAGRPRLQRGVYLLGLAPDTWSSERELPMPRPGEARPVELLSLMVSFEPIESQ